LKLDEVQFSAATTRPSVVHVSRSSAACCLLALRLTLVNTASDVRSIHRKKYPYNRGHFVASFPYFNGTGSAYVLCVRKSTEQRSVGPHSALRYCVVLRTQTYAEPVPLKYGKLATKCPLIYGYFSTVYYCRWRAARLCSMRWVRVRRVSMLSCHSRCVPHGCASMWRRRRRRSVPAGDVWLARRIIRT